MRRDNNLRTRIPDKTRIMRRRRADGNAPFQFGILKSSGSGTAGPPAPKWERQQKWRRVQPAEGMGPPQERRDGGHGWNQSAPHFGFFGSGLCNEADSEPLPRCRRFHPVQVKWRPLPFFCACLKAPRSFHPGGEFGGGMETRREKREKKNQLKRRVERDYSPASVVTFADLPAMLKHAVPSPPPTPLPLGRCLLWQLTLANLGPSLTSGTNLPPPQAGR